MHIYDKPTFTRRAIPSSSSAFCVAELTDQVVEHGVWGKELGRLEGVREGETSWRQVKAGLSSLESRVFVLFGSCRSCLCCRSMLLPLPRYLSGPPTGLPPARPPRSEDVEVSRIGYY